MNGDSRLRGNDVGLAKVPPNSTTSFPRKRESPFTPSKRKRRGTLRRRAQKKTRSDCYSAGASTIDGSLSRMVNSVSTSTITPQAAKPATIGIAVPLKKAATMPMTTEPVIV